MITEKIIFNPKKKSFFFLLGLSALPIFVVMAPFLVGGRVISSSDILAWQLAFWDFFKVSINSGQSLFWNPYNFSGFPSFITATGGFFSPINFLAFKFFFVPVASSWLSFFYFTLAVFFCARLLIIFKIDFWPAYAAGLIYVFSNWAGVFDLPIVQAVAFLPLFFIVIWKMQKNNWWAVWGGIFTGIAFLSVQYSWLLMIFASGFLFCFTAASQNDKKYLSSLFKLAAIMIIAVAISFFQLIPTVIQAGLAGRTADVSFLAAAAAGLWPQDLISLLIPPFHAVFGRAEQLRYLGILPLAFLGVGLLKTVKASRFFRALFVLSILASVAYSPLYLILLKIPVLKMLRVPSRWLFIASFCAAVLSAFGFQYLLEINRSKLAAFTAKILKWFGLIWAALSIIASLIFYKFDKIILEKLYNIFDAGFYRQTTKLPLAHYHQVIADLYQDAKSVFNIFNPYLLAALFFILLSAVFLSRYLKQKFTAKKFVYFSVLIILSNLIIVNFKAHQGLPKDVYAKTSSVADFLKNNPGKYFSLLPGYSEYLNLSVPHHPTPAEIYSYQNEVLPPNLNLKYALTSADYYDSYMESNMAKYLGLVGSDRAAAPNKLSDEDISLEEKINLFYDRKKILDFLGIKYIISGFKLDQKFFPLVFETKVLSYEIPIYVYENKAAKPNVYLTGDVKTENSDFEKTVQYILTDDEGRLACGQRVFFNSDKGFSPAAAITELNNDSLVIKTNADKNLWLIINQNNLPGWTASVDGSPAKLCTLNSVFMAVPVSAGEHEVELKYSVKKLIREILPF